MVRFLRLMSSFLVVFLCILISIKALLLPVGAVSRRKLIALGAPLIGGGSSAGQLGIVLPNWTIATQYYGKTGVKKHSRWVQNSNGDGTLINWAYSNVGGDISSSSVPPVAIFSNTTTDGSGSWKNQGLASFAVSTIQVIAGVLNVTTPATINGSHGLTAGLTIEFLNLTNANDTVLNRQRMQVLAVTANGFTVSQANCGTYCNTNQGPFTDTAGVVWNSSVFNSATADTFAIDILPGLDGTLNSCVQTTVDTGTATPTVNAAACDSTVTQWVSDVNFPVNGEIEMILTHMDGSPSNSSTPVWVATQTGANWACGPNGYKVNGNVWTANTKKYFHQCIYDGSHYQWYVGGTGGATGGANSFGTTGAIAPFIWNHSGGTTSDNNITWQDMGTTNAPLQEFMTTTSGGYTGNTKMTAINAASNGGIGLGKGTIWTLTTAQAADATIQASDLVTAFPMLAGTTYQNGTFYMDDAIYRHQKATPQFPWGYDRSGQAAFGQSLPIGGAALQGAVTNSPHTGTGANYVTYWTGVVEQFYDFVQSEVTTVGLPLNRMEVSPQGSPNPNDPNDPTGLSDNETVYAVARNLGISYNGLTKSDLTNYPTVTTAADWAVLINKYGAGVPSSSAQAVAPGNCDGSGSGRLDQIMALPTKLPLQVYEIFGNEYMVTSPYSIDNAACGTLYKNAMLAFQGTIVFPPNNLTVIGIGF